MSFFRGFRPTYSASSLVRARFLILPFALGCSTEEQHSEATRDAEEPSELDENGEETPAQSSDDSADPNAAPIMENGVTAMGGGGSSEDAPSEEQSELPVLGEESDCMTNGLLFDSLDDVVRIPHNPLLDFGPVGRMTAWVWIEEQAPGGILSKWKDGVEEKYLELNEEWSAPSARLLQEAGDAKEVHLQFPLETGRWTLLTYRWSSSGANRLSRDDERGVTSDDEGSPANADGELLIGRSERGTLTLPPIRGVIGQVMISTEPFNTAPGTADPDSFFTQALWMLSEGKGRVAHDSSVNGLHGVIEGAKWVRLPCRPEL